MNNQQLRAQIVQELKQPHSESKRERINNKLELVEKKINEELQLVLNFDEPQDGAYAD